MNITVADFGGAQEEAVGMAAVATPMVFSDASVPVAVFGIGEVIMPSTLANLIIGDIGAGLAAIAINTTIIISLDTGYGTDAATIAADIPVMFSGSGLAIGNVAAIIPISVPGRGVAFVGAPAKSYFFITTKGILEPLGVLVLRGSRHDLIPEVRDRTISIPGRHGVYDFGSEFGQRNITILAASRGHIDIAQRAQIKRTLAKYLNPLVGKQPLIFADDIDKTYMVKCAGQVDIAISKSWLEFTIPFTGDPIIIGSFEQQHVGSGALLNEGTFESPVRVSIRGAVTNPVLTIGGETLRWTGVMTANDVLEIDTENMRVTLNGINVLANYTGGFPQIQPGETAVTAAAAETTWLWRDRWI